MLEAAKGRPRFTISLSAAPKIFSYPQARRPITPSWCIYASTSSEPEALLAVLKNPAYHFERIGLEAGPLSQWLFSALAEAELPVVCVETRHMQAVLKAQINKTDRNDARGIAQMMRTAAMAPDQSCRFLRSFSRRTATRSASTISFTSSSKPVLCRQPSPCRALEGSPTKRSTSVGRK